MCGIICQICYPGSNKTLVGNFSINCHSKQDFLTAPTSNRPKKRVFHQDEDILRRIKNRGPDYVQTKEIYTEGCRVLFCGAVLWMQGPLLTPQPVENDCGILLYNGDIFDDSWDDNISDTLIIMNKISQRTSSCSEHHIVKEIKSLKGPFSIIYYDKLTEDLYFTRDRIGRSSLVFDKTEDSIVISNVLDRKSNCVEVPATHIYILNIKTNKVRIHSWANDTIDECLIEELYDTFQKQQNIPDEDFTVDSDIALDLTDEEKLKDYIKSIAVNKESNLKVLTNLLAHPTIKKTVDTITELLDKSVEIRLRRQPNRCKECLLDRSLTCSHTTIGVLFSGGLDCTILSLLANKYVSKWQSIDLINVAFKKDAVGSYDVPDRVTGKQSFEELKTLCPSREWNFKEINVPKEELEEFQIKTIADLLFPRRTILDESLGSALWFASRAQDENSVSPCRVLLLGSGADELFGGYKRHYNAFKRRSWSGLARELELDWQRIAFRNLARDNRVICDHGRQPRMPYLDEDFTDYVLKLKPWLKCFPSDDFGPGLGDKLMLRLVAFSMGLREVVTFPKRALQFGSRIANKKERGSDLSKTFQLTVK